MIGNARPQETVHGKLEDEELGSLLLFKVPRHCRHHSLASNESQANLFRFTEVEDLASNADLKSRHQSVDTSRNMSPYGGNTDLSVPNQMNMYAGRRSV